MAFELDLHCFTVPGSSPRSLSFLKWKMEILISGSWWGTGLATLTSRVYVALPAFHGDGTQQMMSSTTTFASLWQAIRDTIPYCFLYMHRTYGTPDCTAWNALGSAVAAALHYKPASNLPTLWGRHGPRFL